LLLWLLFSFYTGTAYLCRGVEFHDHVSAVFRDFANLRLTLDFLRLPRRLLQQWRPLDRIADITSFSVKELPITSKPGSNSLLRLLSLPSLTSRVLPDLTLGSWMRMCPQRRHSITNCFPKFPFLALLQRAPLVGWPSSRPHTPHLYHVRSIQLVGYRRLRRIAS